MKQISTIVAILFCSAIQAQTYYLQGTTDSSLGSNNVLLHNNTLKIGNSSSAAERIKNMLKIGDGDYIQIGEWEADNLLSFKAPKFNFTNGNVGIGGTGGASPQACLDIMNTTANQTKAILARLSESGMTNHLSVKSYDTQPINSKMFAIEHQFFNVLNSAINFHRGNGAEDGFITFDCYGSQRAKLYHGGLEVNGAIKADGDAFIQGSLRLSGSGSTGSSLLLYNTSKTQAGQAIGWKMFNMAGEHGNSLQFWSYDTDPGCADGLCSNRFTIGDNGNVGIGTQSPQNKLDVNGTIRAKEVKVETAWADFVFQDDYRLPSLSEVKNHIETNKHLPGIPTEAEVKENGVNLGEMQTKLLQKIEELTLYVIQQNEKIQALESEVKELKNK